jgi:acetyltransferase-like isoleucine patch superfamily enzyme
MKIGKFSNIADDVDFGSAKVEIGDCVEIGPGVRVIGDGVLKIGDYSKIHRNTFINASGEVILGEQTWVGERSVLDGTGSIIAGDFLGVGIGSSLYSHIRHGDLSSGCNYNSRGRLIIGHDVWFVGQCLVSPVTVGDRSMAMLGSVVTRNMEENRVYAGVPAKDITDKVGPPWSTPDIDYVLHSVRQNVMSGCLQLGLSEDQFAVVKGMPEHQNPFMTYYDVVSRTYTKRLSEEEIKLNKYLFSSRAKFRAA